MAPRQGLLEAWVVAGMEGPGVDLFGEIVGGGQRQHRIAVDLDHLSPIRRLQRTHEHGSLARALVVQRRDNQSLGQPREQAKEPEPLDRRQVLLEWTFLL
jgi:hypothetical protein